MDEGSSSPTNPYAMLHRGQSKRAPSIPVGDGLAAVMSRKTEAPPYEDLINFPRAKDKDEIRCVMCGLPPGPGCVIPRQNKDVCKVRGRLSTIVGCLGSGAASPVAAATARYSDGCGEGGLAARRCGRCR